MQSSCSSVRQSSETAVITNIQEHTRLDLAQHYVTSAGIMTNKSATLRALVHIDSSVKPNHIHQLLLANDFVYYMFQNI